jgi:GrpB-like predicted nucleotidyltransferase (UPF0157 family)
VSDQDRDAYLDSILIGGREQRKIVIVDYDAGWPELFERQRTRISDALGANALRIEHMGSTAVPGLAAKPIIDVLVTVEDADDESRFAPALEAVGYQLRVREPRHRMFRTPAKNVQVHIWADTDPDVERHLAFRDRLRTSAEDRAEYEALKRDLARRDWGDMNDYADAKDDLIAAILARAGV